MKKKEVVMNNKTQSMETNENANPQLANENKIKNNLGEQLLSEVIEKVFVEEEKSEEEETLEKAKRVNALYSPIQKAFDEMQKENNLSEFENRNSIEEYGAKVSTLKDMLESEDVEIEYVVDKLKPRGELSMIYGGSGAGKSMIERCMLFAIAYGMTEYLGFKINLPEDQRGVCLIITEDTEKSMRSLLKRQSKYFEQFRTIENPVFDVISSVMDEIVNVLEKRLKEVYYSLVVIDTPQDDIPGSTNDSTIIRQYFKGLSRLAEKYNTAFTVVTHKRKYTGDKEPSKEDLAGSQALNALPRSIYEFRENVNNPYYRNLTPVKANYESNEFLQTSYVFEMNPDTLTFTDTGLRVPSDQVGLDTHKLNINNKIVEKIKEYKQTNPKIKQKEIIELLNEEFPNEKIDQPRVSRLMKKYVNE